MDDMKILAIIPARGGSKGIKNKNLATLGGRPLIAYTISAAHESGSLDRTIVTTDSAEIAEASRSLGAEVPFLRPAELAQDNTPGIDPILHALQWLEEQQGYRPDFVICLQPTSPFRTADDIDVAAKLGCKHSCSVIGLVGAKQHPYWMKQITRDGLLKDFIETDERFTRRQDLPPVFMINGAIYVARRKTLLERKSFYAEHTRPHIMPPERSLDIDTPWDLCLANLVMRDKNRAPKPV